MKMLAVSLKYHLTSSWVNWRALVSFMYTVRGDNSQVTVCQFASFSRKLVVRVCSDVLTLSCPTLVSENSARSIILSDFLVTHNRLCLFQQPIQIVSWPSISQNWIPWWPLTGAITTMPSAGNFAVVPSWKRTDHSKSKKIQNHQYGQTESCYKCFRLLFLHVSLPLLCPNSWRP